MPLHHLVEGREKAGGLAASFQDLIIRVLFERGAFGAEATAATASALFAYATGLPAYVLIRVLAPGFYAREDTTTPVRIAIAAMVVNIALMIVLMKSMGHVGIALAASASAWLNTILLAVVLAQRGHFALDARLRGRLPRILLATAGMVGVLEIARQNLQFMLNAGTAEQVLGLAVLVGLGFAAYLAFAVVLRAAGLQDAKSMLKARDL